MPVILLVFMSLWVCYANYTPGTFLTGWDTLHPEFNFPLYWSRILDGVWQEHQGLGAVASQAHPAEIPRVLIIQFFSLFTALNNIRYFYAFLMLILGPLGVYFYVKKVILVRYSETPSSLGAFSAGIFYLLNLGTMQHFYVPLEMFLTHYGFLGWVFLYLSQYLTSSCKSERFGLLGFVVASFFIVPQAHTATLFYAYLLGLIIYCFGFVLISGNIFSKQVRSLVITSVKKSFYLLFITICLNSFWLLPNFYYIVGHAREVGTSKIHQLFSEEAFLQNKEFGRIQDVAILRNFLFNWGEHVGNKEFGDLLDVWKMHLAQPGVLVLGYSFFVITVIGLLLALLKHERFAVSLMLLLFVSLFFIFNDNPPLGFVFMWLQSHFSIFKEALRFPFTKFSILLLFTYVVFFGYALGFISSTIINTFRNKRIVQLVFVVVLYSLITYSFYYYAKPAFSGYMISPTMRQKIPARYFEMFKFLNEQKDYGRVADLPINTFWGWQYYDWDVATNLGYQGAGFLWFGIKQPLLNREFDRWNITNENYYREMSTAIYAEDISAVEKVMEKFKIRWLLLDQSLISPSSDQKLMFYPQILKLLANSTRFKLDKDFGDGLALYKYTPVNNYSFSYKYTLKDYVVASDSLANDYTDPIYSSLGDYVGLIKPNSAFPVRFPFVGITSTAESLNSASVNSAAATLQLLPKELSLPTSNLNNDSSEYIKVSVFASLKDNSLQLNLEPTISSTITIPTPLPEELLLVVGDTYLTINTKSISTLPQRVGDFTYNPSGEKELLVLVKDITKFLDNYYFVNSKVYRCGISGANSAYAVDYIQDGLVISGKNLNSCLSFSLKDLVPSSMSFPSPYIKIGSSITSDKVRALLCLSRTGNDLCINNPYAGASFVVNIDPLHVDQYTLSLQVLSSIYEDATSASFKFFNISTYSPLLTVPLNGISSTKELTMIPLDKLSFEKILGLSGKAAGFITEPRSCSTGVRETGSSKLEIVEDSAVKFSSYGKSICASMAFPSLSHSTGYLLEIRSKNELGLPLRVCVTNEYSKRCDLYVSLGQTDPLTTSGYKTSVYLLPPLDAGSGFTLNFSNLVFGEGASINYLDTVSLTPVPYTYIKTLHINNASETLHPDVLVLNEAYEKGWIPLCGLSLCKATHVRVNNWANGWIFDNPMDYINANIVFWPQLLEVFGGLVSTVTVAFVLLIMCKRLD